MQLTEETAVDIAIELWTWLAETGEHKENWLGWGRYGKMNLMCPFCELTSIKELGDTRCNSCPIVKYLDVTNCHGSVFYGWLGAVGVASHKHYAQQFLQQLYQIKAKVKGGNMLREPTVEELIRCLTLETHYKVVHDEGEGKYSSCFIGQACDDYIAGPYKFELCVVRDAQSLDRIRLEYKRLDYRVGIVTYDSDLESAGIYTHNDLLEAIHHADGTADFVIQKPTAILEVKLLKVERGRTDSVYVVKKVWPDKVVEIDYAEMEERLCGHTFKVGDYVMVKPGITCGKEGEVGRIKGPRSTEGYQVDFPSYRGWLANFGELELAERPAPTEEWFDVTTECTLDWLTIIGDKFLVAIYYLGDLVGYLGANQPELVEVGTYKIEPVAETAKGCEWFRILYKVITEYPV